MNLSNANLSTSMYVVMGFLLLLLLPFDMAFEMFSLGEFKEHYLGDILKNMVIVLYGYLLIKRFGYLKVSGVRNIRPQHPLILIIPLYFVIIAILQYVLFDYDFSNVKNMDVVILLGSMMTVGLSEEIIFRGFVLPNLIKGSSSDQPLIVPIVLSSLLFGLLHFLNLLKSDSYFPVVLSQVTYATMLGIAFSIALLRSGSLLPIALLHGLINFSSGWAKLPGAIEPEEIAAHQSFEALFSVLIVLPFFIYALKQLSKLDRHSVLNLYKTNE